MSILKNIHHIVLKQRYISIESILWTSMLLLVLSFGTLLFRNLVHGTKGLLDKSLWQALYKNIGKTGFCSSWCRAIRKCLVGKDTATHSLKTKPGKLFRLRGTMVAFLWEQVILIWPQLEVSVFMLGGILIL